MSLTLLAGLLLAIAAIAHFATILLVACRIRFAADPAPAEWPPVTLLRPVCGLENNIEETLGSSFGLDYPGWEIVFCASDENDPVVPLVRRLIAARPDVPARLLIGDTRLSINPKLNNLLKGWAAARHGWIAMADSNVLLPRDYIQRLLSRWGAGTGLVSAPGVGSAPHGLWAELECAFLNTHQARWLLAADTLGLGYAQGKTMLWRRADLERAGGIAVLAEEAAEDAAATKILRRAGLNVRLAVRPVLHPLGRRSLQEVWGRQIRWARLRRAAFPALYVLEIAVGGIVPIALFGYIAAVKELHLGLVGALAVAWYGGEALLAAAAGWRLAPSAPLCWILRDLLNPAIWFCGWFGKRLVWRGNGMAVSERLRPEPADIALVPRSRVEAE